ncbi:MAG: LacI family transcriptional regulator [Cytophagales bacterium]|nr:LacI family transcriptional regulator [Cytophagales bacterium]
MRKVTIIDIAKELDLSPSTISRALNGIGRMNPKTRQQILDLAERWDYHPNPHAQRLKKSKTFTIGVIVPELTHHFYSRIIKGVDCVLDEAGYQQIICVSDEEYEKEKKAAEALLNARVDGLLVALSNETREYGHIQQLINEEIPVVFLDRMCEDIQAPYVMTDDFEGAMQATQYLIDMGCKKIVFVKGPEVISTTFSRLMGYKESMKRNEIGISEKQIIDHGDQEHLKACLKRLIYNHQIDGLLAHSDYHAFKAMEIIHESGLNVPGDISIIGYADEPLANYTTPKITTVKQPAFEIGKTGMELLMNLIETGDAGEPKVLTTELIIRDSTKNK